MRVLLDECIDQRFRLQLPEYDCQTAQFAGSPDGSDMQKASSTNRQPGRTAHEQIVASREIGAKRIGVSVKWTGRCRACVAET
jgi:hypothetical protein